MIKSITAALAFSTFLAGTAIAACQLPNQLTNGQVADAAQVMSNFNALGDCVDAVLPSGSGNSIQYNNGSGGFAGVSPLTDGQLVIGSTGNPPQAGTITAGAGIAVLTSPGNITIAATGGGSGGGVDWLNEAALVKPVAANFTFQTSTSAPAGAALTSTARGLALTATAATTGTAMMAEVNLPSGNWQATMLATYTGPLGSYNLPGIAVRDAVTNRTVMFGIGGNGTALNYRFDYQAFSGGIGLNTYSSDTAFAEIGLPAPSAAPLWSRLTFDGTNFIWSFSRDGQFFVTAYTISATNYITNRSKIGPVLTFQQTQRPTWSAAYHVLSWNLQSI